MFARLPHVSRQILQCAVLSLAFALPAAAQEAPRLFYPLNESPRIELAKASLSFPHARIPIVFNADALFTLKRGGEAVLELPNARTYRLVFDREETQLPGARTWIGRLKDFSNDFRVIVTTGPDGSVGEIRTPDGNFRIEEAGDHDWLIDVRAAGLRAPPRLVSDEMIPPERFREADERRAQFRKSIQFLTMEKAAPTPLVTIDLMMVYTDGFATKHGGNTNARLQQLVAVANQAYIDSEVAMTLRVVNTTQVTYTDENDNSTALRAITPGCQNASPCEEGGTGLNAAFSSVETTRESAKADLVALIRPFKQATQVSCGVAWVNGSGISTIDAGDAGFGYSVNSEGTDPSPCGGGCFLCYEQTLAHELGHNMGLKHDRPQNCNSNGGVCTYNANGQFIAPPSPVPSFGFRSFSFGYGVNNNFFTVMAYDNYYGTATDVKKFSNPSLNCQGAGASVACGIAEPGNGIATPFITTSADEARSLNEARTGIAQFKVTSNTLTVNKSGTGSGTVGSTPGGINCGATCSAGFTETGSVALTATPAGGSSFAGWSGACSGTGACNVPMWSPASVTATFSLGSSIKPNDFNADGRPDLIWSNTTSGATYIWRMNGVNLISDSLLATIDPIWKVQGVGDFNGDGHNDVVWRHTGNGNTYVWYLVSGVFQSDAFVFNLPPEWVIQGVADFNADGKPDFLMRNTNSGNAFAWFFNNNVAIGDQFLFNIDPSWKVEGVADLNADNQPDLLFRNVNSGLAFAWNSQFSGGNLTLTTSSPPIFSIDSFWEVVQVADWNNDNKPDLLFRNRNTGIVFVWYMDGVTLTTSDFIIQIDPSWEIVPRR